MLVNILANREINFTFGDMSLSSEEAIEEKLDQLSEDRERIICIVTSDTDYFTQYKERYYKEKEEINKNLSLLYKSDVIVDENRVRKSITNSVKLRKFSEFSMFLEVSDKLQRRNLKETFCLGGMQRLHDIFLEYNLPVKHEKCGFCGKKSGFEKFYKEEKGEIWPDGLIIKKQNKIVTLVWL